MKQIDRDILALAVPSILANITIPLVGMADMAVAGHLTSSSGGAALIGGITIGTMLFDLLYWNFGFLRAGTGGLTAQAYGRWKAGDEGSLAYCGKIFRKAIITALLSGLALIALQYLVVAGAFLFVKCSPEVKDLAIRYFRIRIWAAPATLGLFAFKGWFIGMQDTVSPMLADLLVNLLNIALSICLSFGILFPAMGFDGVAAGTLIAQWTGFIFASIVMVTKYRKPFREGVLSPVRIGTGALPAGGDPEVSSPAPGKAEEGPSFFTTNSRLVVRSLCMIAVYIGFTVISARYGDTLLACCSIIMKLLMIFSYFTDGFAYAGEALTGKAFGMRSEADVRETVRHTFLWSFAVAGIFFVLYGFGGMPVMSLMTSDQSVAAAGREFLPWLLLMPLVGCPAFTWDGIYIGAAATKELRDSTILCAIGFFAFWFAGKAIASYAGAGTVVSEASSLAESISPSVFIHILLGAYFIHLLIRSLYQTILYRKAILTPVEA